MFFSIKVPPFACCFSAIPSFATHPPPGTNLSRTTRFTPSSPNSPTPRSPNKRNLHHPPTQRLHTAYTSLYPFHTPISV
ncbi:hypothetical protein K439DRAFT_1641504, partial [Ramaria rubella]